MQKAPLFFFVAAAGLGWPCSRRHKNWNPTAEASPFGARSRTTILSLKLSLYSSIWVRHDHDVFPRIWSNCGKIWWTNLISGTDISNLPIMRDIRWIGITQSIHRAHFFFFNFYDLVTKKKKRDQESQKKKIRKETSRTTFTTECGNTLWFRLTISGYPIIFYAGLKGYCLKC